MYVKERKKELREKYRKIRRSINPDLAAHHAKSLMVNFINNINLSGNTIIIAGYIPIDGEIDVTILLNYLKNHGHRILIPKVVDKDYLIFDDLINAENKPSPNLVITPLISFDKRLNRLGFGKGYYDRVISKLRPNCKFIGVGYEIQYSDDIPIEDHDQALDMIITNSKIYF